ncbi:MAG: FAD-binding protein [Ignavibacteriales bacterium]|nr:FAD-binding protein [Ignavibacteriales bacterium]
MNIKKNKSLKELNTFGVDSLAEHFLKVTSHAELVESMKYIDKNRLKYFVLGGGSNILLGFNKYKGAVVYMQTKGVEIVEDTPNTKPLNVLQVLTGMNLLNILWKEDLEGLRICL